MKPSSVRIERPGRFGAFVVIVFLLAAVAVAGKHIITNDRRPAPPVMREAIVQRGDTLWTIAQKKYGQGVYTPKAVYEIRQANGLEKSKLTPGQRLLLPPVE